MAVSILRRLLIRLLHYVYAIPVSPRVVSSQPRKASWLFDCICSSAFINFLLIFCLEADVFISKHPELTFGGFVFAGVILRPGFIHGTRRVGSMNIPLGAIGGPLELVRTIYFL
jgi:hypothetical protein